MNSKAELKKFTESITAIKSLTRVFEQSAANKMKVNKGEIDKITNYISNAKSTYSHTKVALASTMHPKKKTALLSTSFRKTQKKQLLVLVASQNRYYGNLIRDVFNLFEVEFKKNLSDAIILGNTGKQLIQKNGIPIKNITFYDFADDQPNWEVIHAVNKKMEEYSKIQIFYGEYESVLTQAAKKLDISAALEVANVDEVRKYLFRPEPTEALSFLEQQIIAGSFLQKIYESGVAKYAARVKLLEIGQVAERISSAVEQLNKSKLKARKDTSNRKQMQLFTGSSLWGN